MVTNLAVTVLASCATSIDREAAVWTTWITAYYGSQSFIACMAAAIDVAAKIVIICPLKTIV